MAPRKRSFREKLGSWYLWHRYIGLGAAVFAAWLAVSGIMLNHTEDLSLPEKYVSSDALLALYNVEAPESLKGHFLHGYWIVPTSERSYINTLPVSSNGDFVTALPADFGFIIVFAGLIQLYTPDAILVEEVPFVAGGGNIIAAMQKADGGFWLTNGPQAFVADAELLNIREASDAPEIRSPALQDVPAELVADIGEHLRTHTVTHERLLLDLHSGRLFGIAGVWFADAIGIALLLLALSGICVWVQRARARKRHRQG